MKILTKALMSYDGQTVSAEQIREIEELARQAREITEKAAENLMQRIEFDLFTEERVYTVGNEKGDLTIEFDKYVLRAKNISVIEWERQVGKNSLSKDQCGGITVLHATELYYNGESNDFEMHFLLDTVDESDKPFYWYLTIRCNDIFVEIK